MLPSAAAFVDPLFSTGIPLTLLGIERLAQILKGRPEGRPLSGAVDSEPGALDGKTRIAGRGRPSGRPFDEYASVTLAEADHTARFIAGCYAAFSRFEQFAAYSMFYFAAASYSEMARRLGVHADGARFLGADRSVLVQELNRLSPRSRRYDATYAAEVAAAIEPLNIAGLCDPEKRNWYPVDLQDTVRGAAKLGVTREQAVAIYV
jgi:FADH2 O2-dependent halogenase